jgi:hypothetical protein
MLNELTMNELKGKLIEQKAKYDTALPVNIK